MPATWRVTGGFMPVGHGKAAPLCRIQSGDGVAYYSLSTEMGGKDRLQSFIAIGAVRNGDPYPFDMGGGAMWRGFLSFTPTYSRSARRANGDTDQPATPLKIKGQRAKSGETVL